MSRNVAPWRARVCTGVHVHLRERCDADGATLLRPLYTREETRLRYIGGICARETEEGHTRGDRTAGKGNLLTRCIGDPPSDLRVTDHCLYLAKYIRK